MSALTPTFTTPLLPPLPEFLAKLLYPEQVEADKTQRDIDELETTLDDLENKQETEEPVRIMRIKNPRWMEGKEELKKIVASRPGYRPELNVRYVRDKSRDIIPEAKKPESYESYTLNDIPESQVPEPKIPKSQMPRVSVRLE